MSRNEFRNEVLDPGLRELLPGGRILPSDVSDHLNELVFLCQLARPGLVVELGTRGGASTRALLAGARHTGGRVLSVDIDPCGELDLPQWAADLWDFQQADDIAFADSGAFAAWCDRNLGPERPDPPVIDLLYIDTSHRYEHTVAEIERWFPAVREGGIVVFHDTHMRGVYRRFDNTCGHGWPNARGVIRAVEEHLGIRIPEQALTTWVGEEWALRHQPWCSGLTVLVRRAVG